MFHVNNHKQIYFNDKLYLQKTNIYNFEPIKRDLSKGKFLGDPNEYPHKTNCNYLF